MFPQNLAWQDDNIHFGLRCYNDSTFGSYTTGLVNQCDDLVLNVAHHGSNDESVIVAFPNPSNGVVNLKLDPTAHVRILELTDVCGKTLRRIDLPISAATTTVEIIQRGVYVLKIVGKGKIDFEKVIIY
jgi:intracellular sulfur oxidation DsrE/DsrF family protein